LSAQELRLQKEKVRIYALARELNMESKDLLEICRQAGIDVKNQLSSLDPDQRDAVELMVKRGGGAVALAEAPKQASAVIPSVPQRVPVLPTRTTRREPEAPKAPPVPVAPPVAVPTAPPTAAPTPEVTPIAPAAQLAELSPPPPAPPTPGAAEAPKVVPDLSEGTAPAPRVPATTPPPAGRVPVLTGGKVPDLGGARPEGTGRPRRAREVPRPAVVRVAAPPTLKQRPLKEEKKPAEPVAQKPIARLSAEALRGGPVKAEELLKASVEAPTVAVEVEDEESEAAKGKKGPGQVTGRDKRHQQRSERAKQRKGRGEVALQGGRTLLPGEEERPQRVKAKLGRVKVRPSAPTQPRKGKVPLEVPITVRSLSEAIGMRWMDVVFRLRDHGAAASTNINSAVSAEQAEAVALEAGCELDIKRPLGAEGKLLAGLQKPDNPEDLVLRAPIVTIMGHVDHGKTSLLDKIRASNVAATEAGGITQVIRAWRVEHSGRPVTFLDTPGHEAFTKMRARGAQVTDIAVIVVAADDGVMPQTEEAISHAKAAGVPIVVAINKVDLPNANVNKTRQQLYGQGLIPDTMGGDVPFVETSAATGKGIDELLDMLSLVAELRELKANPNKPAKGTCLEAMLSEGEGVLATLLVLEGTLHRGDVVLCGAAYGRVRALYDDLGRPIQEAGPSVPVRITGLDEVPNADDPFQAVPDLAAAREVAEKRKTRQQEAALVKREPVRLEKLSEAKIAELKVILKADFRGSIEAIRKELEKLQHEEVRVRVLHTGIGAITESDVQLALTSPGDTVIVGFNVVPDDRAKSLAEERGVGVRQYAIIYNLTDDIRSALEGKLKPREEVIHLGRALVRETFKISRVGTIAGCYVTQGTIERSAKIQLIREGVVIYPPPDRTAGLESLKRFKDDVREVREGFECGLKIAGYDDLKVGDLVVAYRIEQVQRTL
jgi:translation initiation factor IF-2